MKTNEVLKLIKEGTKCAVCGKPIIGKPRPGADVYHEACIMEDTKCLREFRNEL